MNLSLQCKFGHFHLIDVCCPLKCMGNHWFSISMSNASCYNKLFHTSSFFHQEFLSIYLSLVSRYYRFMFPTSISNSFFPKFHLTNKTLCEVPNPCGVISNSSLWIWASWGLFFYLSTPILHLYNHPCEVMGKVDREVP